MSLPSPRTTICSVIGAAAAADARVVVLALAAVVFVFLGVVIPGVWSRKRDRRLAAQKVFRLILGVIRPPK